LLDLLEKKRNEGGLFLRETLIFYFCFKNIFKNKRSSVCNSFDKLCNNCL